MTQNNKNSANFGEFMRIFFKNAKRKRSESEAKAKRKRSEDQIFFCEAKHSEFGLLVQLSSVQRNFLSAQLSSPKIAIIKFTTLIVHNVFYIWEAYCAYLKQLVVFFGGTAV